MRDYRLAEEIVEELEEEFEIQIPDVEIHTFVCISKAPSMKKVALEEPKFWIWKTGRFSNC